MSHADHIKLDERFKSLETQVQQLQDQVNDLTARLAIMKAKLDKKKAGEPV